MQAKFEMTDGWRNLKEILSSFPDNSPHWNEGSKPISVCGLNRPGFAGGSNS